MLCSKCGREQGDNFSPNNGGRCRPCEQERARIYRQTHASETLARLHVQRAEHPEKRKTANRKWRTTHREKHNELNRNWKKAHPEAVANERARRATLGPTKISASQWRILMLSTNWRCLYCWTLLTNDHNRPTSRTIDHIVPLSLGGKHEMANLAPCCARCNSSKNNRVPWEWCWETLPLDTIDRIGAFCLDQLVEHVFVEWDEPPLESSGHSLIGKTPGAPPG